MKKVIAFVVAASMAAFMAAPALADDGQFSSSGDLSQSFNVVGGGDNSNQCVGGQVVGNTGNAQNQLDLGEFGDQNNDLAEDLIDDTDLEDLNNREFDNFLDLLDDVGDGSGSGSGDLFVSQDASVDVSPVNSTDCTQSVDQTATANG